MILIANEIVYDPMNKGAATFVCTADRRITNANTGRPIKSRRKVFEVDGLNATVSFFGLVEYKSGRGFDEYFSSLHCRGRWNTVATFANWLLKQFNAIVDKRSLRYRASGFHIAGFSATGIPEMWYMTNICGLNGLAYQPLRTYYEFSERIQVDCSHLFDAALGLGDFKSPISYVFANGDLRAFTGSWTALSRVEAGLIATGLVPAAKEADRAMRMRWKMETIGTYYKLMTTKPLIGKPIDVYQITPNSLSVRRY